MFVQNRIKQCLKLKQCYLCDDTNIDYFCIKNKKKVQRYCMFNIFELHESYSKFSDRMFCFELFQRKISCNFVYRRKNKQY